MLISILASIAIILSTVTAVAILLMVISVVVQSEKLIQKFDLKTHLTGTTILVTIGVVAAHITYVLVPYVVWL